MLAGVEEIDDLDRAGEVLFGNVPDPFGAVADDDFLLGTLQPRFQASAVFFPAASSYLRQAWRDRSFHSLTPDFDSVP